MELHEFSSLSFYFLEFKSFQPVYNVWPVLDGQSFGSTPSNDFHPFFQHDMSRERFVKALQQLLRSGLEQGLLIIFTDQMLKIWDLI